MERGPAIPVAIVDPRARVEQQDSRIAMAFPRGDVEWRVGVGWNTQVDVGAEFEERFYGRAVASKRCIIQASPSIRFILEVHATTSVAPYANKRINVAARSVKTNRLVDEGAFLRAPSHRTMHRAGLLAKGEPVVNQP